MLSLKSYLIGPPCVGKTTTLRRLTGEIDHLSPNEIVPSTGINTPLTVQLYQDTEQSSVLISEGWKSQGLSEQCRALCSCILNYPSSSSSHNTTHRQSESSTEKQSTSVESSSSSVESSSSSVKSPSSKKQSSSSSSKVETVSNTEPTNTASFPIPSSSSSSTTTQPEYVSFTAETDEITDVLSLVKKKDWEKIRAYLKADNFTLINIVDIGGQPEFHEILPLLLHGLAFGMLFIDMTKTLDHKYKVVYREDSGPSHIQYKSQYTIKEIIRRALHSISSLQSGRPTAILVGTHHDMCSKRDVQDLERSVQEAFANFIQSGVLCSVNKPGEKESYIYPVNNMSGGSSDIEGLRELITTVVHKRFKSEPVPTATLLLHLVLRMKFDPTPGLCSFEECIKIAERCGISREDLLKKKGILQYLHDRFGTILYYRGLKIGRQVIVNTNLVMRPPAELFVTAFGATICEHKVAEKIRETGEIPFHVMEEVCSPSRGQSPATEIPTDEIVELLKSRYILYENVQSASKEKVYFLPCLLYPDHKVDKQSQDLGFLNSLTYPPILLIPKKEYVPLGSFPATVVELSQNYSCHWRLDESLRFRNRLRFYFLLPNEELEPLNVELCSLSTHLEFRILHDASSKPINPRLIPVCLQELKSVFDKALSFCTHTQEMDWDFGFYCPHAIQSGRCPHPARCWTDDNNPKVVFCKQQGCVKKPVALENKHRCWFRITVSIPYELKRAYA